jgi:hypothetical protein
MNGSAVGLDCLKDRRTEGRGLQIEDLNVARERKTIKVIIPDASPLLTLARVGRLDVLRHFVVTIQVVDVVKEEALRPVNDVTGNLRKWFDALPNNVEIVDTTVGLGLQARRQRGEDPPTGQLGEIAVDEHATVLARQGNPAVIPLVLFEDPDVLELRIARLRNVHLLNTAAMLIGLAEAGIDPDARQILKSINDLRKSPMLPIDRPARTKKIESEWVEGTTRAKP